jgi:hypothetical protein
METKLTESSPEGEQEYLKPICTVCGIPMVLTRNVNAVGRNGRPVILVQLTCPHCLNSCVIVYYSRIRQDGFTQPSCLCFWANPETGKEQFAREDRILELLEEDRRHQAHKKEIGVLQN